MTPRSRQGSRRPAATVVLLLTALAAAVGLAACSDDPPTTAAGITLPPGTVALPSSPVRPPSTGAPTTVPVPLTLEPTTQPGEASVVTTTPATTTSTVPPAPCDQSLVEADIGKAGDGYAFIDLKCAGAWATIVAQAQQPNIGTDELVVLTSDAGHWSAVDGGGDTTCQTAGIPVDLWGQLGCSRWQRSG